jgi:hypothetical protein
MYILLFIATFAAGTLSADPKFDTSENYYRGTSAQEGRICQEQARQFNEAHRGSSIKAVCVRI